MYWIKYELDIFISFIKTDHFIKLLHEHILSRWIELIIADKNCREWESQFFSVALKS